MINGRFGLNSSNSFLELNSCILCPVVDFCVTDKFYQPHASPEAITNGEFSAASDVFAAGMTLLRAANNMPAWDSVLTNSAWPELVREGRLADWIGCADHVPPKLKRIIKKAVNPIAAARYPTAAAFRQDLERLRPARSWVRLNENEWACTFDEKEERAFFQPGDSPSIEYTIGGRRRHKECKKYRTEREARANLAKLVAISTLH